MIRPGSRAQFFNDKADCLWLRCTHLRGIKAIPFFRAFVIVGNEDCPECVYLYEGDDPVADETPLMIVNLLELEVAA